MRFNSAAGCSTSSAPEESHSGNLDEQPNTPQGTFVIVIATIATITRRCPVVNPTNQHLLRISLSFSCHRSSLAFLSRTSFKLLNSLLQIIKCLCSFYFVGCFRFFSFSLNSKWKRCYFLLTRPPFYFIVLSRLTCRSFSFQHFALNFNFLHCLGIIYVFLASQHAEIFACIK